MVYRLSLVFVWAGIVFATLCVALGVLSLTGNSRDGGSFGLLLFFAAAAMAITHTVSFVIEPRALARVYRRWRAAPKEASPVQTPKPPSVATARTENDPGVVHEPEYSRSPQTTAGPTGIGGWLLVPALGLIVGPIRTAIQVWTTFPLLSGIDGQSKLYLFVLLEIIANLGLIAFTFIVAAAFFRREATVPRLYQVLLAATLALVVADAWIAVGMFNVPLDREDTRTIMTTIVAFMIWVPYFARSVRVRNTFVE